MNIRRLIPYILTIVVFDAIYWVTMIIPNQTLYLGYGDDLQEVIMNNKIPLHREIFIYGLAFAVLGINFLEIVTTKDDAFFLRLVKSTLTIIITYLIAALIFILLDVNIWNLFFYHRGTPANIFILLTIIMTLSGLIILEFIKRVYLQRFDKSLINRYIPLWLKLE